MSGEEQEEGRKMSGKMREGVGRSGKEKEEGG